MSGGRSERVLRTRSLISHVFMWCSCVFLDLDRSAPFMGRPAFPFIGQGKARVTAEENEKKREREEGFQDRRILLLLHTGPADPVDVNRDGSMSWPYSSLTPCAGISGGHGIPLCPSGCRGELTHVSASVRGLGRIAPKCPTLFLM